jgi:hypothetical protein
MATGYSLLNLEAAEDLANKYLFLSHESFLEPLMCDGCLLCLSARDGLVVGDTALEAGHICLPLPLLGLELQHLALLGLPELAELVRVLLQLLQQLHTRSLDLLQPSGKIKLMMGD